MTDTLHAHLDRLEDLAGLAKREAMIPQSVSASSSKPAESQPEPMPEPSLPEPDRRDPIEQAVLDALGRAMPTTNTWQLEAAAPKVAAELIRAGLIQLRSLPEEEPEPEPDHVADAGK